MTKRQINERIGAAIRNFEPNDPTYICPGRGFRCPYLGGVTPCPDGGMCQLAQYWIKHRDHASIPND